MRNLSILSITALLSALVIVLLSITVEPVSSRPSIENGWAEYHRRFGINDPKRMANQECENSVSQNV